MIKNYANKVMDYEYNAFYDAHERQCKQAPL